MFKKLKEKLTHKEGDVKDETATVAVAAKDTETTSSDAPVSVAAATTAAKVQKAKKAVPAEETEAAISKRNSIMGRLVENRQNPPAEGDIGEGPVINITLGWRILHILN